MSNRNIAKVSNIAPYPLTNIHRISADGPIDIEMGGFALVTKRHDMFKDMINSLSSCLSVTFINQQEADLSAEQNEEVDEPESPTVVEEVDEPESPTVVEEVDEPEVDVPKYTAESLGELHWKQIENVAEDFGIEYTNKKEVIEAILAKQGE